MLKQDICFSIFFKMAETEKDIATYEIVFELNKIRTELEKININLEKYLLLK